MKDSRTTQHSSVQLFENPLWTIEQAAQVLSIAEKTLRDWVLKRQIPFKKIGRLVRLVPSDIQQWIEEGSFYVGRDSKK